MGVNSFPTPAWKSEPNACSCPLWIHWTKLWEALRPLTPYHRERVVRGPLLP